MKARTQKEKRNPVTRAAWTKTQVLVQLRFPATVAAALREQAKTEVLPLSAWIRRACQQELRRAQRAA
jgi:hypothetical protein